MDTAHFKGNYPDRASIEAALFDSSEEVSVASKKWRTLLAESKLEMDKQHEFESELESLGDVSHVRLSIYPDGGISRVRLYGRPSKD